MIRRGWMAAVACLAAGAFPATAAAGPPAWTTYRHDAARSGIDPDSTSPVTPTQMWQTPALDGEIWGQPLVYGSRVYVATENDTVYALDFSTGSVVWQKHLATAVDSTQLPCGDIHPTVGITSTPAIDPATGRIYVVADEWGGSDPSSIAHDMYALNLSNGSVAVGPVPVDPPGSTHTAQLQRTSLALDAGKVIIGYGGNDGDCGSYHGWLVAVPEGGGQLQTFEVDRAHSQGAIWGSGNAPAIDSTGDIWISTGNGNSGSTFDFSESVIRLDPNLNVVDWWAPSNWSSLDGSDTDLGSSMPVLLPNNLVFEIGKGGVGYLLNATLLGSAVGAPLFQASICSGSWGGAIYVSGVIYVTCSNGLHALTLSTSGSPTFAPLASWTVNTNAVGPPTFAGGLVWSVGTSVGGSSGEIYGLNPTTGATSFSANLGSYEHFTASSAGGGLLFVANKTGSGADQITAFRIARTPSLTATKVSISSSSNPATVGRTVTLTATVTPAPDAGTVGFADAGETISGCGAVPVSVGTGRATCSALFRSRGAHPIVAKYSGDAYYLAANGALTQSVTAPPPPPPTISHLRVRVVHRKLRLRLTLSEPARLTVVVWKLVPGRRVHRRCRAGARHGRRCEAKVKERTLHLNGKRGSDGLRPRMRPLAPGRYLVTVTAIGSGGARSLTRSAVVVVRHG